MKSVLLQCHKIYKIWPFFLVYVVIYCVIIHFVYILFVPKMRITLESKKSCTFINRNIFLISGRRKKKYSKAALANSEFRKVCEFCRINRMVLHPYKTNYFLFSRSTTRHDIELFCNNNNENQNIADNVSVIRRVTNNDTVPAVKFLGVFLSHPFI